MSIQKDPDPSLKHSPLLFNLLSKNVNKLSQVAVSMLSDQRIKEDHS